MSLKSFSEKELAQLAQGEMVIKFDSAGAPIGYFAGGSFVNDTEEQGGVTSMSERGFEEFYKNYLKEIEKEGFSVEENSRVESKEKTQAKSMSVMPWKRATSFKSNLIKSLKSVGLRSV